MCGPSQRKIQIIKYLNREFNAFEWDLHGLSRQKLLKLNH